MLFINRQSIVPLLLLNRLSQSTRPQARTHPKTCGGQQCDRRDRGRTNGQLQAQSLLTTLSLFLTLLFERVLKPVEQLSELTVDQTAF